MTRRRPAPRVPTAPLATSPYAVPCDCGCDGVVVRPDDLAEFLDEMCTDDDVRAMRDCRDAQLLGDAGLALDHHHTGLYVPDLPQEVMLRTLELIEPSAPPWAIGRWILWQAWTSMLLEADPRTAEASAIAFVACIDPDDDLDDPVVARRAQLRASSTMMAVDTGLFHLGGLVDHLDLVETHGGGELLDRVPELDAWAASSVRAYRHVGARGAWRRVVDLRDDTLHEVYDIGSLDGVPVGGHVVGRIVPDGGGGEIFALRPLATDQVTAEAIAADRTRVDRALPPSWTTRLFEVRDHGRLVAAVDPASPVLSDQLVDRTAPPVAYPGLVRLLCWSTDRKDARPVPRWRWR